jgi:hypothetical protein
MVRWIGAAFLLVGTAGCFLSETAVTNPKPLPDAVYVVPSAPESVLVNLAVAHAKREVGPYADLLAPEYTFRFAGPDAQDFGRSTLSRSEDSLATGSLFGSRGVEGISVLLPHGDPVPAAGVRFPAGTMLIRVNSPELQVSVTDGTTWSVSNLQEFYFRPGRAANGEDPARWFLLEWDEIAGTAKPAPPRVPSPQAVRPASWGVLKLMFWENQ